MISNILTLPSQDIIEIDDQKREDKQQECTVCHSDWLLMSKKFANTLYNFETPWKRIANGVLDSEINYQKNHAEVLCGWH